MKILQTRVIELVNLGYTRLIEELDVGNLELSKALLAHYTLLGGMNCCEKIIALSDGQLITPTFNYFRNILENHTKGWVDDATLVIPNRYFKLQETAILLLGLTELCRRLKNTIAMNGYYVPELVKHGDCLMAGIDKMHMDGSLIHAIDFAGSFPEHVERNWLAGLACFAMLSWGQFRVTYSTDTENWKLLYIKAINYLYEINEKNIGHLSDLSDVVQVDQAWLLQANSMANRAHINEKMIVGNFSLTVGHICNLRDVRNTPKKLGRRLQALAAYVAAFPDTDAAIINLLPRWTERLIRFRLHDIIKSEGELNISAYCHVLLGLIRFLEVYEVCEKRILQET